MSRLILLAESMQAVPEVVPYNNHAPFFSKIDV
jgi:hypothetical protein